MATAGGALRRLGAQAAPAAQRIEAVDFVRGAALFGILLMNITAFGLPYAYESPAPAGGAEGANLWAWIITNTGFEGTQRALFSILFGAGVILLTSRLEAAGRSDVADIYFRRNMWLIVFGMVDAYLFLWFGDILYAYGIIGMFLFVFRKSRVRMLLVAGLGALLLNAAFNLADTRETLQTHAAFVEASRVQAAAAKLSEEQRQAIAAWEEARTEHEPTPAMIANDLERTRGGYWSAFGYVARVNARVQSWGLYRHYFLDGLGMMLIGMALFRLGVLTLERPSRFYLAMAGVGYGVGLSVSIAETWWIMEGRFGALAFAQTAVSYDLGRLFMTMGHLAALLLFVRSGALERLRRAVAAVGRMALTAYLTQSIVCTTIFVVLGLYGRFERHQLYYVVAAIWAAQLIFSSLWLRHFRFGPAEWLWRWLTYLKRPPLRKPVGQAGAVPAAAE